MRPFFSALLTSRLYTFAKLICNGYDRNWLSDKERNAFKAESRRIFQTLGWTIHRGTNGVCDTVTKDRQDLYLYPTSFSGVVEVAEIPSLVEHFSTAKTFHCYHVDYYEEYTDMSDEEYRTALEAKRGEITDFILENCRTKRTNRYIVDPVAARVAQQFEICRLCDKDRRNSVGIRFVSELIDQLLQQGRLVTAETDCGPGIRTATARELKNSYRPPAEQLDGQISMMF